MIIITAVYKVNNSIHEKTSTSSVSRISVACTINLLRESRPFSFLNVIFLREDSFTLM